MISDQSGAALPGVTITATNAHDFIAKTVAERHGAEVMVDFITPLRDRTNELMGDPAELDRLLAQGAARARDIASVTLARVYERMGFLPSLSLAGVR